MGKKVLTMILDGNLYISFAQICSPKLYHRPAHGRGMASPFSLMKKYQKIKPEKTFHPQGKTPWPGFPAGLCPLLISLVLMIMCLLMIVKFRQQKSFGRNQGKRWWVVRLQGHTTFAKRGPVRMSNFCGPRFYLVCSA
jgi:hypothetical protein